MRLTKKEMSDSGKHTGHYFVYNKYANKEKNACINKLGQLEDVLEKYNIDNAHDLDIEIRANRDKVYKYESVIKKELGIDLDIYIKLVQEGFVGFVKDDDHDAPYLFNFFPHDFAAFKDEIVVYWTCSTEVYKTYQYKDYGKTWALTKEELL